MLGSHRCMQCDRQTPTKGLCYRCIPKPDPAPADDLVIWSCKIGEIDRRKLPKGSDEPMREAVEQQYYVLTGEEPSFIFSGWADKLHERERAVVEDREPRASPADDLERETFEWAAGQGLRCRECCNRSEDGHKPKCMRGRLLARLREVETQQPTVLSYGDAEVRKGKWPKDNVAVHLESARQEIEKVERERDEAREWVDDLQSGMYINCVYCGHRYGPNDEVESTMSAALTAHVEQCVKHPLYAARQRIEKLEEVGHCAFEMWCSAGQPETGIYHRYVKARAALESE